VWCFSGIFSFLVAQSVPPKNPPSLSDVVRAYEQVHGFSGAVRVAIGDRILLDTALGYADRSFGIPNTRNTRFSINSISKTFVALAFVLLEKEGLLDTDDPVNHYIPELAADWSPKIRLHHLLSHTSGLPREFGIPADEVLTLEEQWPLIGQLDLMFASGERYSYSNAGYALLGLVLERVTGQDFGQVIQERILEPLALDHTGVYQGRSVVRDQAVPYRITGRGLEFAPRSKHYGENPGGGMYSTVDDLHRYVRALHRDDFPGADVRRDLFSIRSATSPGEWEAFTWSLKAYRDDTLRLAAGSGYGTKSAIVYSPGRDMFIGITSNFGNVPVLDLLRDLLFAADSVAFDLPDAANLARPEDHRDMLGRYCFDGEALRQLIGIEAPCVTLHEVDGRLFLEDELLSDMGQGRLGLSYTRELWILPVEGKMIISLNGTEITGKRER
jgi:CubicO group peptidase (beta-lactamase class C family)